MTNENLALTKEDILHVLDAVWCCPGCKYESVETNAKKSIIKDFLKKYESKPDPKVIEMCVSSGNYPPLLFALRDDGRVFLAPIIANKPITWEPIDAIPAGL